MKTLRIRLVATRRSDLLCVACGNFLGAAPLRKLHWAVVANDTADDSQAETGLRKYCEAALAVKRQRADAKREVSQDDSHA